MAESVSFDELVATLPVGGLPGVGSPEFGVALSEPAFVPPTLRVVEQPMASSVTLISARGATGKSTLARQLSAQTGAPLWKLDEDRGVSADALESRLGRYLGPKDPVARFCSDDRAFVIVDALDEALMRVSGTSWSEYVESIAAVASQGRTRFVLLGRERVLDDVWLRLADADVTSQWLEISHFDATQREAYVDKRVALRGSETQSDTYKGARDAVLAALAGTVDSTLSESFVGYAPVLDAVVALLAGGNLIAVRNMFESNTGDVERVAVLVDVLLRLLKREQDKTVPLAQQLGVSPDATYSPDEQIEWLASHVLDADPPSLDWCPEPMRADYAGHIQEFLRDHPFRAERGWASPVFSAFVAAKRFGDLQIRDSLRPIGAGTGLLFEFVAYLDEGSMIDEWQFAALHSSLLAAEWQAVEAMVAISSDAAPRAVAAPVDQVSGELVLLEDGLPRRRSPFQIVLDRAGRLSLLGPMSFLSVVFPGTVVAHGSGSSLTLGPDLFIRCVDLQFDADTLQIARRAHAGNGPAPDDASVVLELTGRFACDAALTGNPAGDVFELRVRPEQRLSYPWVAYRSALEDEDAPPDQRAVRFLNMLMNLLRKHGRQEWAVLDKKLEGRQSVKGDEFAQVLAELGSMGVITVGGVGGCMILLHSYYVAHRFDGKGRPGLASLEDKISTWRPVLDRIASVLA